MTNYATFSENVLFSQNLSLFTNNVHTESITNKKQAELFRITAIVLHQSIITKNLSIIMINFMKIIAVATIWLLKISSLPNRHNVLNLSKTWIVGLAASVQEGSSYVARSWV